MAAEIEEVICQKALEGWGFVTFSVTNSCKAILVFRVPDVAPQGNTMREEAVDEK